MKPNNNKIMYPMRDEVEFLQAGQHLQHKPQEAGPQQHNNYQ